MSPKKLLVLALSTPLFSQGLDLSGPWAVQLDRLNQGSEKQWYARALENPRAIGLPNSLINAGLGDPVDLQTPWIGDIIDRSFFTEERYRPYRQKDSFKVPFWLQPETYYTGVAWYQRTIRLDNDVDKSPKQLVLERVHWRSSVWLDTFYLGSADSLSTTHRFQLPVGVKAGEHRLSIRVENGLCIDLGVNSHSISDHTQGNWNGIVGKIELIDQRSLEPENLRIFTDLKKKSVRVDGLWEPASAEAQTTSSLTFEVVYQGKVVSTGTTKPDANHRIACELAIDAPLHLWDETSPQLYELRYGAKGEKQTSVTFGFRQLSFERQQWFLNGNPLFLRGTLECAVNPLTGYPPTDRQSWRREFARAKEYGLNHFRFHSWCPPEAAFEAADELGIYLQIEAASWSNQSTVIGSGLPNDAWIEAETKRILAAYGNHPSFLFMAYGNEPAGPHHEQWLSDWVKRRCAEDDRRVYTAASGWPNLEVNQYHVDPRPRGHQWAEGLNSRMNAKPPETQTDYRTFVNERKVPTVSHEIGQWCAYPNFKEIAKYTGPYKAKNFEIFRDLAAANGMLERAEEFLHASGRLQLLCYKEEIESALRTPKMGGFELLGLQDFPGQGSALVGLLDAFWDSKGYTTGDEVSRFCAPIVPLLRLPKRVYTSGEALKASIDLAQYSNAELSHATVSWTIASGGKSPLASGVIKTGSFPVGLIEGLGDIEFSTERIERATCLNIAVRVDTEKRHFENDWNVWVYPTLTSANQASKSDDLPVFTGLSKEALSSLNEGKTIVVCANPKNVTRDRDGHEILLGFTSIFWNTAWTTQQAPHTLGLSCDPKGPLFENFPTGDTSDWQWWYVIHNARPLLLGKEFTKAKPLVTIVDDWFTARNLALLAEARVGSGKVIISGADLTEPDNIVKAHLLRALKSYVHKTEFSPSVTLTPEALSEMVR